MLRLKTDEEFRQTGWRGTEDGFEPPFGSHGCIFLDEMSEVFKDFTEEDKETIIQLGNFETVDILGYGWGSDMFVFNTPRPMPKGICGCVWNKHPLYCSCPK